MHSLEDAIERQQKLKNECNHRLDLVFHFGKWVKWANECKVQESNKTLILFKKT